MPKKKQPESEQEQSDRFKRDAQAMIDAGELSLTDADRLIDQFLVSVRGQKSEPSQ